MGIELEFKAKVDSHAPLRKKLRQLRATFTGKVLETNSHFDTADRQLLRQGCGLRIRQSRDLSVRNKDPETRITFKGRLRRGAYKAREEIETIVGDHDTIVALLLRLGLREQIRFEKKRETWVLRIRRPANACKIELDEIPRLGLFIEIEAANRRAIRTCLRALGLKDSESILHPYVGMLAATAGKKQLGRRPLVFKFSHRRTPNSKS